MVWFMQLQKDQYPDRTGPNRRLWLHTFQIDGPPVAGLVATFFKNTIHLKGGPSKYLQNEPKIIENDQYLTELLNFY